MKILISLFLIIAVLFVTGCTSQRQGTRTVTTTWNNRTVIDNAAVELVKAFKGTPTGNTGGGFQILKQTSWTDKNMPEHWG